MKTFQCISIISGVYCYMTNASLMIDNERVIVGSLNGFIIVNIHKCEIENKIINKEQFMHVTSFIKLRDNITILCACDKGKFCFYNKETREYCITNNNHYNSILGLLSIDNSTFASYSLDGTIKIWKY